MRNKQIFKFFIVLLLLALNTPGFAQQGKQTLPLSQAVDSALQHNHQLKVKEYQLKEKKAATKEAKVKRYPSLTINSTYRYNGNTGSLEIPQGSFGSLPLNPSMTIPLPDKSKSFDLGKNENFNAGVTLYQPITQQAKIGTGVRVSQTQTAITGAEKDKAVQEITLSVERLYFGLLINGKKQEEAEAKLDLAKMKLHDAESAIEAGKTVEVNKTALQADVSDKKQELLKLKIEAEDYLADFENLTGISLDNIALKEVALDTSAVSSLQRYKSKASVHNTDLHIASLKQKKSKLAVKAARQSYLPDLGLIAGYTYQKGNVIYPTYNPYVGVNFKWNLQDIFSDKHKVDQRKFLYQQAKENRLNTREEVDNDVAKAYRKLSQVKALIKTASEAVDYRRQAYKIQQDQSEAGLNTQSKVLDARASLAKSEADLYEARLQYRLALSKLRLLTEESNRSY